MKLPVKLVKNSYTAPKFVKGDWVIVTGGGPYAGLIGKIAKVIPTKALPFGPRKDETYFSYIVEDPDQPGTSLGPLSEEKLKLRPQGPKL